jgi:hypothetical protein
MQHFYQQIGEDWMDFHELYSEMVSHFSDGAHFVEVGSWKGRSTSYMAVEIINSKKNIQFDCIDTWLGSEEHLSEQSQFFQPELKKNENWLYNEFKKNTLIVSDYINPIRLDSLEASKLYKDRSIDFIFIDASHDYQDVLNDITYWYPKVKKGGFIAGHDYTIFDGVKKAVDEVMHSNSLKFDLIKSYWVHRK